MNRLSFCLCATPAILIAITLFDVAHADPNAPQRTLTALVDIDFLRPEQISTGGSEYLILHGALHIDATEIDGALRIQILCDSFDDQNPRNNKYICDVRDYTTKLSGSIGLVGKVGSGRKAVPVGTTRLTNKELMDPSDSGAGVLRQLWTNSQEAFQGRYEVGISDCMAWLERLTTESGPLGDDVKRSSDINQLFEQNKLAKQQIRNKADQYEVFHRRGWNVGLRYRTATDGDPVNDQGKVFPIDQYRLDRILPAYDQPLMKDPSDDVVVRGEQGLTPLETPREETRLGGSGFDHVNCGVPFRPRYLRRSVCDVSKATSIDKVAMAKIGGSTHMIAMAGEAALHAVGGALTAIGAAFVILDFIDHNWTGAAFGVTGLLAGIAAGALAEGPIGWFVAGIVTVFFAILPGLFSHKPTLPDKGNIAQAIQFKFFGDASHTGNEQCRKSNPNCTALYGAGVLASVLQWENFDAIAFLIAANEGYPISIPDMANFIKTQGTAHAIATINCSKPAFSANFWNTLDGPDENKCYDPNFTLDRKALMLPHINQTAAQIYDRMIPKQNGDCKLVNRAANNYTFVNYNITVTGLPVSIACNITPGIDVQGALMPFDKPALPSAASEASANSSSQNSSNLQSNTSSQIMSPADGSTNGLAGAYIAPPRASPFAIPFDPQNSICFYGSTSSNRSCFPNGTYVPQTGQVGTWTSGMTLISVPSGAHLRLDRVVPRAGGGGVTGGHQGTTLSPVITSQNTTISSQPDLQQALQQFNDPKFANKAMNVYLNSSLIPPIIPASACFFTEPFFTGQIFCLGTGKGNLTSEQSNVAQSIKVFGDAIVYIFTGRGLGDGSETKITSDIPDLKTQLYGTNDNLSRKVNAVWIAAPSTN